VASVDEQKLRRSVLGILGRLLLANLGQVPDVKAAVGAGRSQDGLVVRRPLNLEIRKIGNLKKLLAQSFDNFL